MYREFSSQCDECGDGHLLEGPPGPDWNGNDCNPRMVGLNSGLVAFCQVAADCPKSSELFAWAISGFPQEVIDAAAEFAPSNQPPTEAPLFNLLLSTWRAIHRRRDYGAHHAALRFEILTACLRKAAAHGKAGGGRITRVLDEAAAICEPDPAL